MSRCANSTNMVFNYNKILVFVLYDFLYHKNIKEELEVINPQNL